MTSMATNVFVPTVPVWPVDKEGFRLRGEQMTRTETFTDAAFAFAVTLLVVSVDAVPTSYEEMVAALRGVPAFALSFLMLMVFWRGHWRWSRRFGLEDGPTLVLSSLLVFTALVYVYPLKYVSGLFLWWASRELLGSPGGISNADQLHGIFAVYGFGFVAMSFVIAGLNLHALRLREELQLSRLEEHDTKTEIVIWAILGSVGLLSAVIALLTEFSRWFWPGWVYMVLPLVMPAYGRRVARVRRTLVGK